MRRLRPIGSRRGGGHRQARRSERADGAEGSVPRYGARSADRCRHPDASVASDFEQRGGTGAEEQVVQELLVLQHE